MKLNKKTIYEKSINILLNILMFLFGIILLISIYTGVQTKILGNKYADFFGYSIFEVQTGSMEPEINAGDWIIVKLTQKVKLNDTITYETKGEYITHKVVEIHKGTYVTRGVANSGKDKPIDQTQIVGKVTKRLGNFGIFRKTLFNPAVLITLIITIFLISFAMKKEKNDDKMSKFITNILNKISKWSTPVINKIKKLLLQTIKKIKKLSIQAIKKIKENQIQKKTKVAEKIESTEELVREKIYDFSDFDEEDNQVEEIEKTSLYRVVSVEENEVDKKYRQEQMIKEAKEEINESNIEDELDKTSMFRVIPVDLSELDETFLEIAKNELQLSEQEEKQRAKMKTIITDTESEEEDTDTKIDLNMLKNNTRKNKNMIDGYMNIKIEEMNEIISILNADAKQQVNEATIKNILMTTYIHARYYNYYGEKNIEYNGRKMTLKIEKIIRKVATELIKEYDGTDTKYNGKVDYYMNMLILFANLEQARESITDIKAKIEFCKNEIAKYYPDWENKKLESTISEISKIQRNYDSVSDYYLKKVETNTFALNLNKVATKKDLYAIELQHNLSFNRVYSDYIIDKTYSEGIIAEDKLSVLLTLLLAQMIRDMEEEKFNKNYIFYIPSSLYAKQKKFEKFLRMIDDEYVKSHVMILITFQDLIENKQFIKNVRKQGYKFVLTFDEKTVLSTKDRTNISMATMIFVNKKATNVDKIMTYLPEERLRHVVYDDILDKTGEVGGE